MVQEIKTLSNENKDITKRYSELEVLLRNSKEKDINEKSISKVNLMEL